MNDVVDRIKGTMPALVTPLTPDLKVDVQGMRRLIEYVINGGVHGVVVLGSSGEFQSIDWDQREIAVSTVAEAVKGRVPVLAGAGLPNLRATIDQIQAAAGAGADACLVTPPYYFPIGQGAIVDWFGKLVQASPVPILYYHFPRMTKLTAEPDTVVRLRDAGVAGIKDSGGATTYMQQVLLRLAEDPGFKFMLGGDVHYQSALVHGADGTIGISPNVVPHIGSELYESHVAGDFERAAELQRQAVRFVNALVLPGGQSPPAAKAVLERLGICGRTVAPPFAPLTPAESDQLWQRVEQFVRKPASVA